MIQPNCLVVRVIGTTINAPKHLIETTQTRMLNKHDIPSKMNQRNDVDPQTM
jgi:hypothetical protein